jgi:uncharacterized protein (TIGR03084 family)
MDSIRIAWQEQQDELGVLLDSMDADEWDRIVPRTPDWVVTDVVLHLAQTNEMAIGSGRGNFDEVLAGLLEGAPPAATVDEGAAVMVDVGRGDAPVDVHARWRDTVADLADCFDSLDPSARVMWVAGTLSVRTLMTTRLAETWIHTTDIGDALGREPVPTDRLEHVARLAWRTLPYAFQRDGRDLHGPVAFELTSPAGQMWSFVPDDEPVTTIRGPGAELALVAARRLDPRDTSLTGEGPDTDAVLELVRTFA